MIVNIVIILCLFSGKLDASNKTSQAFKELFKKTIIGYDCSRIQNLTTHKTAQIETCEEDIIHKVRTNIEVQVLQKSELYSQEAFTCSMRRTRKISHCGSYHHGLNLNADEMTYETIPISKEKCQYMHKYKAIKLGLKSKKYDIVPNKENIIKHYVQG